MDGILRLGISNVLLCWQGKMKHLLVGTIQMARFVFGGRISGHFVPKK